MTKQEVMEQGEQYLLHTYNRYQGETEIVARFGLDGELRFGIVFLEPLAAFEAEMCIRDRLCTWRVRV